jgi:hypothetical protein
MARQGLALRGHDESDRRGSDDESDVEDDSCHNRGNFIELLNLLAEYDKQLKDSLRSRKKNALGTSNRIQNEIIESLAKAVIEMITQECAEAPYLALLADETKDISGHEQLCLWIR